MITTAGKLWIDGDKIRIECLAHVAIRLRRLFASIQRHGAGEFEIAASPSAAFDLRWFMDRHPLALDEASVAKFDALCMTQERRLASIAEVGADGYTPPTFELALPPREYQREAADLFIRTGALLLADDIGVGKTASAICSLVAPDALPALVVTMTHLTRQWERELERFAPKLTTHRVRKGKPYAIHNVRVVPDGKRRRVVRTAGFPDVLIINYHKLNGWAEHLANRMRTVIFDEVQELRHGGSLKYDGAATIRGGAERAIGLSATPIYNYGGEIHAVMDVVAPGALGTRKEFCQEWCGSWSDDMQISRKLRVADPKALGTYLRDQGLMLRRTRRDVGRELPAFTRIHHVVECDEQRIKLATGDVAELARRVLNRIGSNLERMKNAGELDYRLRQATGIGKAGAVAEFVRILVESGERVVLYGWHHEVYALWMQAFERDGIRAVKFTGQESDKQKADAAKAFIEGRANVIVMSLRAGAGLDGLQFVSRTVVFGELDWSPMVHLQDEGRVHRDGQKDPVAAYYLVAEQGSDPVISDVLGIKTAQSEGIRNPNAADEAVLTGASEDHIRRLAEDFLQRRGGAA